MYTHITIKIILIAIPPNLGYTSPGVVNDKPLPFQQGTWRKDHDLGIDSVNSLFDCIYGKGPCYLPIQKNVCHNLLNLNRKIFNLGQYL